MLGFMRRRAGEERNHYRKRLWKYEKSKQLQKERLAEEKASVEDEQAKQAALESVKQAVEDALEAELGEEEPKPKVVNVCPDCGKGPFKRARGLRLHMNNHCSGKTNGDADV